MIAVDTSSFIAYLQGETGSDVEAVDMALEQHIAVLPPVALTELLSDPKLASAVKDLIRQIPVLGVSEDYWQSAGFLRAKIASHGLKARLADALIAQSCLDNRVALITRDKDFRHYEKHAGLRLVR